MEKHLNELLIIQFASFSMRWIEAVRKEFLVAKPNENELADMGEGLDDFPYDIEFFYKYKNEEKVESIFETSVEHSTEPIELDNGVEFQVDLPGCRKLVICEILSTRRGGHDWDETNAIGSVYGFERDGRLEWMVFQKDEDQPFSEKLLPRKLRTVTFEEFRHKPSRLIAIFQNRSTDTLELVIHDEEKQYTSHASLGDLGKDICQEWNQRNHWDYFMLIPIDLP